jgi:hypothetical protein
MPGFTKIRVMGAGLIQGDRRTERHDETNRRFPRLMGPRLKTLEL